MRLTEEIHCHTIYSHGKNTIEENVKMAVEKGFKKIVISEHGNKHYFAKHLKNKDYMEMKEEILRLRNIYNIEILMGLEANIISTNGDIDVDKELLEILDVLYVGIHFLVLYKNISSLYKISIRNKIAEKSKDKGFINKQMDVNTNALIKAINKYPIKMITHPGTRGPINLEKLARECEKKDVILEINNTQEKLNANDLTFLKDYKVNFLVGSDAHSVNSIGAWENAEKIIKNSKINLNRVLNVEN